MTTIFSGFFSFFPGLKCVSFVFSYMLIPCFTVFHYRTLQMLLRFLQIEGDALHQQKDYSVLDCDAHFIAVVWY